MNNREAIQTISGICEQALSNDIGFAQAFADVCDLVNKEKPDVYQLKAKVLLIANALYQHNGSLCAAERISLINDLRRLSV